MRILIPLFFILFDLASAQIKVPDHYKSIPHILDSADSLYPFIIPDKKYDHWQVCRPSHKQEPEIIYENQRPENTAGIDESSPNNGFFRTCQTPQCFSYILICNNNQPTALTSEKQLKDFIGPVDNLSEAILIAMIHGFSVDPKNRFTGSYTMDEQSISIYGLRSETCPVKKESFLIKIDRKTGQLEAKSNGIYEL